MDKSLYKFWVYIWQLQQIHLMDCKIWNLHGTENCNHYLQTTIYLRYLLTSRLIAVKFSCPPLTRPLLLQWKIVLIREVGNLLVFYFLNVSETWPYTRETTAPLIHLDLKCISVGFGSMVSVQSLIMKSENSIIFIFN